MALITKDSPVGVDVAVNTIQNALYTGLVTNGTWTNYESYPRAYRNETKNGIKPEIFTGNGNDYVDAFSNDKFTVTSFFLTNNETVVNDDMFTSDISVIFQVDLNKLYTRPPHRFDEEFRNQIVKIFRDLNGYFSFVSAVTDIDSVYEGIDTSQVQITDTHPCHVVRFELTANYQHACDNVFATGDCTIKVDEVTTTDESVEGAGDGTATAVISGLQGNATFLWNDPAEQTTNPAISLNAGTYSVIVTDDNAPLCTASGSGTVEIAPPLPSCGIEITGIVVAAPSAPHLSDGTATATVTGATNIGYRWGNGQTTNPATGLSVGDITLTALDLDVLGCSDTLTEPVPARWDAKCELRGDEATSINDGSPTTSDIVEKWADLSGCGNDALQSVIGSQPTWEGTYLQFDGSDFMDLAYTLSKIPNRSIYIVFKQDSLPGLAYIYGDGNSSGTTESTGSSLVTVGSVRYQSNYGGNNNTTLRRTRGSTAPSTNTVLYSDRFTSGAGPLTTLEIDGVGETETDGGGTATAIDGIPSKFSLGRLGELTSLNITGRMYEFIFFSSEVTPTVHADVTNYLTTKYGL